MAKHSRKYTSFGALIIPRINEGCHRLACLSVAFEGALSYPYRQGQKAKYIHYHNGPGTFPAYNVSSHEQTGREGDKETEIVHELTGIPRKSKTGRGRLRQRISGLNGDQHRMPLSSLQI